MVLTDIRKPESGMSSTLLNRVQPQRTVSDPSPQLFEVLELRFNLCMLFYCVKRDFIEKEQDGDKKVSRYDMFDSAWLKEMFAQILGVPKFTMLTSLDAGSPIDVFLIDDGKCYCGLGNYTIKILDCSNYSFSAKDLKGHTDSLACLAVEGDKLYSGGYDCTIRVWNCSDSEQIKFLHGHEDNITCLTINDGKLYSGSADGTINIWNCIDDSRIKTLEGFGEYSVVAIHGDRLYCTGDDNPIKIWDCSDYNIITTLERHSGRIACLTFDDDNKLYSCGYDYAVKIWDCNNNYNLIHTLDIWKHGDIFCCQQLIVHDGKLYLMGILAIQIDESMEEGDEYPPETSAIWVYDCNDFSRVLTLTDHGDFAIHNDKLYSVNGSSYVEVRDCHNLSFIATLEGRAGSLAVYDDRLYSGSSDGSIKIWRL